MKIRGAALALRVLSILESYATYHVVKAALHAALFAAGCDEDDVEQTLRPRDGHERVRLSLPPVGRVRFESGHQSVLATHLNSTLRRVGAFHPRVLLLKLANQVVSEVREYFGERVFETMIPRSTRLAEAPSFGKPIIHYDKYSSGSAAYEVLAQEFVKRLDT